jgi:NitT/TauT family transport system permease protein
MLTAFKQKSRFVLPLVVLVGILLLWDQAVRLFEIPTLILPNPKDVYETFLTEFPRLFRAARETLVEVVLAAGCAIVGGLFSAFLIFQFPVFRRAFFPYILMTQTMPKVALAPVLIVWFGVGFTSRLVLAFLIAYFPMVINTVAGLAGTSETMLRYARSLSASGWQIFVKVRVPNALPAMIGGVKITVGVSVIGIIVGEFVASEGGLGRMIFESAALLETPLTIASILLVAAIGLGLVGLVELLERFLVYWTPGD